MKFEIGTVVWLKSGGPKMTVEGQSPSFEDEVVCQWFVDSKVERGSFVEDMLTTTDPDDIHTPIRLG